MNPEDAKGKNLGDIDPTASISSDLGRLLEERDRLEKILQKKFQKVITVMFTDMKGSTALADEEGNLAARLLIKQHNDIILPLISGNNGILVKTMGDGTLSWFSVARDAVRAGVKMQIAVEEFNRTKSSKIPILIRVGMHTGEGLVEKDDIFGDVVNVASRFESQANVGEVYLSEETYNALADKDEFHCRFLRMAALKGKKEEFKIFKAYWKPDEIGAEKARQSSFTVEEETGFNAVEEQAASKDTSSVFQAPAGPLFPKTSKQVAAETVRAAPTIVMEEIGRPTQVIQITKDIVTIGRALESDIVLEDTYCSRRHAQIITDEGQCFIEDMDSKIGMAVNGERVSRHRLKSGDEIMIGEIRLTFVEAKPAAMADADATMVRGHKRIHKLVIRITPSKIAEYPLIEEPKIIGRLDTADIFINDNVISRRHAKIWEKEGTVFLEDLGSHNGTMVDGQAIPKNTPVELSEKSAVRIGDFNMIILDAMVKADISLFSREPQSIMDKMKTMFDNRPK